jgi:hypothetical protein
MIGAQTLARKEKATTRRIEILGLATKNTVHRIQGNPQKHNTQPEPLVTPSVKARTLSLFDRVKQKQLANGSNTKPTAESVVRHHAIGRLAEVVEILRMKQQQKRSSSFISAVHVSPSKIKTRVSFSLTQLVTEIRNSVAVPIGEDEARMCLKILADEVPGSWIALVEVGLEPNKVTSVVLNGDGMSGLEAQRRLQEREKEDTAGQ